MTPDKDGVGEVLIRGPMVFSGYYHNPEATAEAFTDDGWFRSGDLGKLDKDGNLYIVGRGKGRYRSAVRQERSSRGHRGPLSQDARSSPSLRSSVSATKPKRGRRRKACRRHRSGF